MFHHQLFDFIGQMNKLSYELSLDFQPSGLSALEFSALEFIYHDSEKHLKDIQETFALSDPQSRRLVKKLMDKSLVIVHRDKSDFRKRTYEITREGKAKIDESYFQVSKGVQKKYDYLNDEEKSNLEECMQYILKLLHKER